MVESKFLLKVDVTLLLMLDVGAEEELRCYWLPNMKFPGQRPEAKEYVHEKIGLNNSTGRDQIKANKKTNYQSLQTTRTPKRETKVMLQNNTFFQDF